MSNTGWAPKPRKDLNLNGGIFSHGDEQTVKIEKANRWSQQRSLDGSPHTRHGASALTPPPAGPKLRLNDLEKATAADQSPAETNTRLDPEDVVKAYFNVCDAISKGDAQRAIAEAKSVTGGKSLSEVDEDEEEIAKDCK